MAKMDRNVNLEEINTDSFLGIDYTKHQSLGQKILFFGMFVLGVIGFLAMFLFLKAPIFVALFFMILSVACGILFGCNYNEHLSLFEYISLLILNRPVSLASHPREDIETLLAHNLKYGKEDVVEDNTSSISDDDTKKYLIILGIVMLIVIFIIGLVISKLFSEEPLDVTHHEAMLNMIRMNA